MNLSSTAAAAWAKSGYNPEGTAEGLVDLRARDPRSTTSHRDFTSSSSLVYLAAIYPR